MSEDDVIRGQELYAEARVIVDEEVKLQEKSGRNIVRLASILRDLRDIFERSSDTSKGLVLVPRTKGFANFRACMLELLRPLDRGERTGWYYLSIGTQLLGKVTEAELEGLSFEKIKQLARVAKAKNEVPTQLLAQAKDPQEPATKLREKVDVMLFGGSPDHSGGPMRSLTLVGAKDLIDSIEDQIKRLRPAATEHGASMPASDAQVVDYALADCLGGVQLEEDHEMELARYGRG